MCQSILLFQSLKATVPFDNECEIEYPVLGFKRLFESFPITTGPGLPPTFLFLFIAQFTVSRSDLYQKVSKIHHTGKQTEN